MTLSQDQLKRSAGIWHWRRWRTGQKNPFTPRCSWWGRGLVLLFHYLAVAGIGTIGILDSDRVDFSNLNRQILYKTKDGTGKSWTGENTAGRLNWMCGKYVFLRLNRENAEEICSGYDVIVDCLTILPPFYNKWYLPEIKYPWFTPGVQIFRSDLTVIPGQGPCLDVSILTGKGWIRHPVALRRSYRVIPGVLGTLQVMEIWSSFCIGEANR